MNSDVPNHNERSSVGDPLAIATRRYFYKPYAAFFNAFHLRAFQAARVQWQSPVLDVGCSDGEFGLILAETVGVPDEMTGIDLSSAAIKRAAPDARALYQSMPCANAGALPFADGAFGTVVISASLISIDPGLEQAMAEAYRVLRCGGTFYATVCTDQYEQYYWISRLLNRLVCRGLARRYMDRMNRRMQQGHLYAPDRWIHLFEENGFSVIQHFGFMPLRLVSLWSFLAWMPLRLHSAVKLIPCPHVHRGIAALYKRLFSGLYERTPARLEPDESGYIFIEAVKK